MDSFRRYLSGLKGCFVQLDSAGPDACQGWLAFVQDDYVTLRSPEGEDLHLPLRHIRTVLTDEALEPPPQLAAPELPGAFRALLAENLGRHVRVYHAGPDVAIGILRESDEDHLVLEVSPGATICFSLFHVRSLYVYTGSPDLLPMENQEPFQGR